MLYQPPPDIRLDERSHNLRLIGTASALGLVAVYRQGARQIVVHVIGCCRGHTLPDYDRDYEPRGGAEVPSPVFSND